MISIVKVIVHDVEIAAILCPGHGHPIGRREYVSTNLTVLPSILLERRHAMSLGSSYPSRKEEKDTSVRSHTDDRPWQLHQVVPHEFSTSNERLCCVQQSKWMCCFTGCEFYFPCRPVLLDFVFVSRLVPNVITLDFDYLVQCDYRGIVCLQWQHRQFGGLQGTLQCGAHNRIKFPFATLAQSLSRETVIQQLSRQRNQSKA